MFRISRYSYSYRCDIVVTNVTSRLLSRKERFESDEENQKCEARLSDKLKDANNHLSFVRVKNNNQLPVLFDKTILILSVLMRGSCSCSCCCCNC